VKPALGPSGDLLTPVPSPRSLAEVQGAIAHHPVKPRDDIARRLAQGNQFDEGVLHDIFGRMTPLPRVKEERRAVGVNEAREVVRTHL
jgi:hypothetical protein